MNVAGSSRLLDAAAKAGVGRILSVSSMSAYEGTGQIYGQAKLAIERATLDAGGIAIPPRARLRGTIRAAWLGTLRRLTKLPVLPDLGPGARQFPVHEDDLARTVVEILAAPGWTPEAFGVAQPRAVDFRSVLLALADDDGRRHRFVRVPWQALYGVLAVAEKVRLSPVRADSILGLVRPAPFVPPSAAFPDLPRPCASWDRGRGLGVEGSAGRGTGPARTPPFRHGECRGRHPSTSGVTTIVQLSRP